MVIFFPRFDRNDHKKGALKSIDAKIEALKIGPIASFNDSLVMSHFQRFHIILILNILEIYIFQVIKLIHPVSWLYKQTLLAYYVTALSC